jgi:hypothetical protein
LRERLVIHFKFCDGVTAWKLDVSLYEVRSYKIKFKKSAFEHDRSLVQLMEGAEIQGSSKVNLLDNIQKIKYSGVEFIRKKKHILDKGIFLSSDAKQLLIPLGVKYNDGKKDKIVWKFYLGHQIIEEGESSHEKM